MQFIYVHLIDYEWYNKNAPDIIQYDTMLCPCPSSSEARIYFWQNVIKQPALEEVDCIRIRYVRSSSVRVSTKE